MSARRNRRRKNPEIMPGSFLLGFFTPGLIGTAIVLAVIGVAYLGKSNAPPPPSPDGSPQ